MSLEKRIAKHLVLAMKARDEAALRTLRAIKSQILLFQTSGSDAVLDESTEIKLLQKMVKQRRESLGIYEEQGRTDLAATEKEEIAILSKYLPEQLDENGITEIVDQVIADTGASGMKDMGRVMGQVKQKIAGRAEGKVVAGIVKSRLNS